MTALTKRETEVAMCVASGWRNADIALELDIDKASVRNYVHSIFKKRGFTERAQLAAWYRANFDKRSTSRTATRNGNL